MTAIEIAERAVAVNARETERRYVRAMAKEYSGAVVERNIVVGPGHFYRKDSDITLTRRIIRRLGHRLHGQMKSRHASVRAYSRTTRIALFGEILLLKRQLEAHDA